jgi:hypothetical protein
MATDCFTAEKELFNMGAGTGFSSRQTDKIFTAVLSLASQVL